jgi:two-component system sensor histidine kinase KdpD
MHPRDETRPNAEELLRELGVHARLTVYLASAPGAGKTRRLLQEARALQQAGIRVAIGWIETKSRPDLDALLEGLPLVPPRTVRAGDAEFADFDYDAAVALAPTAIVLDELAHTNLPGGRHAKRWQDALALRDAGISVLGALNVAHLETVAPIAEAAIGYPIREIVPISFLKAADQVVALDVSPAVLASRLRAGAIVDKDDIDRALSSSFRPQTLHVLRELLLRTLDDLTVPVLSPNKASTALGVITADGRPAVFVRKMTALAAALDLSLELAPAKDVTLAEVESLAREFNAQYLEIPFKDRKPDLAGVRATLVGVSRGALALRVAGGAIDREIFIADPDTAAATAHSAGFDARHPYAQTIGDRLRIGYGKLTVYLGAAAGCGKTYAMLDRAKTLLAEGVDVVGAVVETHGRPDTMHMLEGIETLPRTGGELDRAGLLARKPQVALIDELAHTNPPGSAYAKRYDEVLSILRAGISVITTLNVQHLEGLNEAVYRLTGTRVRETLPDGILELADEVIFVDATPELLRERLRAGKVYPKERIDAALSNFFRTENLAALRELAIRETMRARATVRLPAPFKRWMLGVKARERDTGLILRCARLAARLDLKLIVAHVARREADAATAAVADLQAAAAKVRAAWHAGYATDPARGLVELAASEGNPTLVVEGARRDPAMFGRASFARRLLEAGAKELVLLAPSE